MCSRVVALVALTLVATGAGRARAQSPRDAMVQPPTFKQPERGSLVGGLAKLSIGAEDVTRGSYTLALPVEVPSERAALGAAVLPSYGPENGISEWGIGWSAGLAIQRFRLVGDVDYQTDGFTSPWGRLVQGSDGFYYPVGLKDAMRLEKQTDRWIATSPSGTRTTFRKTVGTPEGVYAWYATRVESLLGEVTEVEYAVSPGGRPFVTRVRYGGPESPQTYRLDFEYETLPVALVDYRSGYPLVLDRRVTGIVAYAKEGGRGAAKRRWRYDLTYRDSEFGPGFYLDSAMRTFASGETEPPVTYDYDLPEQASPDRIEFRTGDLEAAPLLQSYLDVADDPDGLQPEWAARIDVDEDGLPDLEHGNDFTLFRQSASGTFVAQPLGPRPPGADPACRPPDAFFNRARTLVRMAGVGSPLQVLVLEETSSTTKIRVCNRAGTPQLEVEVPGHWRLDANMKIADLNRDDKPDLLLVDRAATGTYEVLENISGEGCPGPACVAFGFRNHAARELAFVNGFPFTPSGTWVHDLNGDGNPDLVLRSSDRMSIWYGRGRFLLEDQERKLRFLNRFGNELFNLDPWEVSWVDANQDGLTDALMALGNESALFLNEVDHFQEVVVPVLEHANTFHLGAPIVGDFRGQGDTDLTFVSIGGVSAAGLTLPSTGLLVSADDGKGTVVDFAYQRAPAQPGLRQRPAMLDSLTVATAGYDPARYDYTYGGPTLHRVGHFLVGFSTVTVMGPQTRATVAFHHDDDIAGQVESSLSFDLRTPELMKFAHTAYEEALHAGIRLRRSKTHRTGWCGGTNGAACLAGTAPAVAETSQILAYQRGVCPTHTRKTDRHGQLETVTSLVSPAGLGGALHCLAGGESWTGTHTVDPTRNFRHDSRLTRNDLGQVTKLEQLAGSEALTLQEVTYDATTYRLQTVSAPGQGVQRFTFNANSGQLQSATGADGVIASAPSRELLTDAFKELVGDRGPGGVLTSSFRYDGMERLARRWNNFGGSSMNQPLETLAYHFPTTELPALVRVDALIDAAAQTRKQSAVWSYPDGEELTRATRIPGGWVFDPVTNPSRAELRTRRFRRAPLSDASVLELATYATVRDQTTFLGETVAAGFGHPSSTRELVQENVERRVATTLSIENGLLVTTARENDTFETRSAADASGRPVSLRNQTGAVTQLAYDALGRLIGVTLVDGTRHRLRFDGFGRPAQVVRDRLGTVSYFYQPTTGRLDHKDYADADGELERTAQLEYDPIGRVTQRVHRQPSGDESRFRFRYDGEVGDGEVVAGQRGYTTRVEGPAYTATTVRNPDGSEASSRLDLAGWMQIDVASTYYAGGAPKDTHRTITRLSDDAVIDDLTTGRVYDASGRLQRITLNGQTLATIHYDEHGRLAWVDLAGGQRIDHLYDPTTHRQTGYMQEMSGDSGPWQTGLEWTYDNRGLIASEAIDLAEQSWLRTYGYDARGFLRRAEDADQRSTYTYTATGLPNQITDQRGTRTVFRGTARTLTVAGIPYTYDASGRVIGRGPAAFVYGPDGNLATADVGARTLAYHYDADGNRILKYEGGVPVTAFWAGAHLTNDSFIEPVNIGGRLVGVLENGAFHLLATDPRGTLLADRDGTPRLPTPYGVRTTRPDLSAALDYVEKSYDADLESVRMGVRDYDPLLGQFWTPDPLYLEAIEKCAESPVDCNLFSYARNNPISMVDPTGMEGWLSSAASWMGDKLGLAADTTYGALSGVLPLPDNGPAFGNARAYYGAQIVTSSAAQAVDRAAQMIGLGAATVGAGVEIGSGGAATPVAVPVIAAGLALAGAAEGAHRWHAGKAAEALNHYNEATSDAARGTTPAPSASVARRGPTFIGQESGPSIVVPQGATGPTPALNGAGVRYTGGAGGPGLSPKVTDVRIMNPTPPRGPSPGYPAGYGSYSNASGQTVNPVTGRTIAPSDPWWHIPLK